MRPATALAVLSFILAALVSRPGAQPRAPLAPPTFHHLHLNSINPEAAIDFYTRQFASTAKATFAGQAALRAATNVWVLFNKVATPPATDPQTAFWHFGWHVTDVHKSLELFKQHAITLLPLYTEEAGGTVFASSDTWPGSGGLGLTKEGIAEAKATATQPAGGAGFAYLQGPDDAIVEYQGDMANERFNHIHMFQEQPYCAQLWYQQHLNAAAPAPRGGQPPRTDANCRVDRSPAKTWPALTADGMFRTPSLNSTAFSDVSLYMYMNQSDRPLAATRGHLIDHFGLRVADLDAWISKLREENVAVLEPAYLVGANRAVMIEGPSREAIEIIEIK